MGDIQRPNRNGNLQKSAARNHTYTGLDWSAYGMRSL
jgi:hypothetical protein